MEVTIAVIEAGIGATDRPRRSLLIDRFHDSYRAQANGLSPARVRSRRSTDEANLDAPW